MNAAPFMTPEETAFLAAHLTPQSRVWEWGSGGSTLWLAARCSRVTTVEHDARHAALAILAAPPNVSVLYHPPEFSYIEGTEDDGDLETFRSYVGAYTGELVDVVIIDGRARLWCARQVAEGAAFGPHDGMAIFLHDAERAQYERIWRDDPKLWGDSWFLPGERVGNLMRLVVRT